MQHYSFERARGEMLLLCVLSVGLGCSSSDCLGRADLTRVEEVDGEFRSVGTMKDGKKHGQWVTYHEGVLFDVKQWAGGKLHGPFRTFHDNGRVMSDGRFVNGIQDGRHRIFLENGRLVSLSFYNHGDRERTWCEWHPDGRLRRIAEYSNDELMREERDPPGTCPLLTGDGKRHLDVRDVDDW